MADRPLSEIAEQLVDLSRRHCGEVPITLRPRRSPDARYIEWAMQVGTDEETA